MVVDKYTQHDTSMVVYGYSSSNHMYMDKNEFDVAVAMKARNDHDREIAEGAFDEHDEGDDIREYAEEREQERIEQHFTGVW